MPNTEREDTEVSATTAPEVTALNVRVSNIETVVGGLSGKLDDMLRLITERGETKWQHIFAAGTLMVAILGLIGGALYMPILSSQNRNEMLIGTLQARTEVAFDKTIARMEASDANLRAQMVPRAEHEAFWKSYEKSLAQIEGRITRLENARITHSLPSN